MAKAKKLILSRETLRRLTSTDLRLVAGGRAKAKCTAYDTGCSGSIHC